MEKILAFFKKKQEFFFLLFIVGLFILFGTQHLGQFMSVDEPKWVNTRVPQLYEAIEERDWAETYINDKPGILPAALAGITNFFLEHEYYKERPLEYEYYLFYWRLPIILFNAFLLIPIYHFCKKLLSKKYAMAITILIALNPILIGISQIVNPDATLWSTSFLAFLTFFLFLKTNEKKYVFYSGIFLGLALLSKFFVTIFYPIFFLIIYLEYLFKITERKDFLKRLGFLTILYAFSVLIYFLLFPATRGNYNIIWEGTLGANILSSGMNAFLIFSGVLLFELIIFKGKISDYLRKKFDFANILLWFFSSLTILIFVLLILNLFTQQAFFNPEDFNFVRREINIYPGFVQSFYNTLLTLTPLLLIGFFFFIISIIKKNPVFTKKESLIISSIFLVVFVFISGSSMTGFLVTARFQTLLHPLFAILSTFFIFSFVKNYKIALILIFISTLIPVLYSKPFYYHYNNCVRYLNYEVTEPWGFGGYEVAQKMNELPEAQNLTVWVDRQGFAEFFVGKSVTRGINPYESKNKIDYLILTKRGEESFEENLSKINTTKSEHERNLGKMAKETDILKMYYEEAEIEFMIHNLSNKYIRAVKFYEDEIH